MDNGVGLQTGTLKVRARLANPNGRLLPGAVVKVAFRYGTAERATVVPELAIGTDQGTRYVLVAGADGTVEYRPVSLGAKSGTWRVVNDAVRAGEQVVLPGLPGLRPGHESQSRCGGGAMNFSRFFIDRPIAAVVLSAMIVIAGALSLGGLPLTEYPQVTPPTVVVRAVYPGANPKVIAETVAAPLEQEINGVEGMLYMSSQAVRQRRVDADRHVRAGRRSRTWRRCRCRTASRARRRACRRKCSASASPRRRRRRTS